jgi:hypothetical protein
VTARFEPKPRDEAIVFIGSDPTVLTEVVAESFLTDSSEHLLGKVTIAAIKVNALRHFQLLFLSGPLRISAFSAFNGHSTERPQRYAEGRRGVTEFL